MKIEEKTETSQICVIINLLLDNNLKDKKIVFIKNGFLSLTGKKFIKYFNLTVAVTLRDYLSR